MFRFSKFSQIKSCLNRFAGRRYERHGRKSRTRKFYSAGKQKMFLSKYVDRLTWWRSLSSDITVYLLRGKPNRLKWIRAINLMWWFKYSAYGADLLRTFVLFLLAWDVQSRAACPSTISRTGPAVSLAAYHSHVCGSTSKDTKGAPLRGLPEVHWGFKFRV